MISNTTTSGCRARSRSPAAGGGASKNTTRASPHRSRLAPIPESSSDFPYNPSHIEIPIYRGKAMVPRVPKVHCTFQIIELLHLLRDSSPSQAVAPGLFEDLAAIPELQPVDDLAI